MAIFHMNVSTGSRNGGQSAGAKADYILREGSYSRDHAEVDFSTSDNMPAWAQENPKDYWRAADSFERANGRLFKQVEFALPKELTRERQRELAKGFAKGLTEDEKLPYTLAIHTGKGTNPHCHLMISERKTDEVKRKREQWFKRFNAKKPELGGAQKTTSLMPKQWLQQTREKLAQHINHELERAGINERVDHRSYKDQGIDKMPGLHLGPRAAAMQKKGLVVGRAEIFAQRVEMQRAKKILVKQRDVLDVEIQKLDRLNKLNRLHKANELIFSTEKPEQRPGMREMERHLGALECKKFDIAVVDRKTGEERRATLTQDELQKQSVWLAKMNKNGHDIYVRPAKQEVNKEFGIVLVDGLSKESLKMMEKKGYNPAVVIQKSTDKYQSWVKIRGLDSPENAQKVAKFLATVNFADLKQARSNAWGRLAGFDRGSFQVKSLMATGEIARESKKILDLALMRERDFSRER